ncbi:MAG TPA: hypothetical protein VEY30_05530, partial [Myxococcaceae bacterium]|nr:hypothetical protein [Myxococcaceae bacterium]
MIRRVSGENSEGPRPGRRNRLPGSRLRALAIVRGQEGADDQLQARYWKFVFEHFDQPPSGLDPIHLEELISYAERCEKVGAPINSQARLEMLESNTSSSFDPSALSDRAQSFLRSLSRRPEAEKELEALRAGKSVVEALKARRIHIPDELLGPGALDPLRAAIQAEQKRLRDALGERLRGLLDRGERGEIFFLLDLEGPMATSKL